MIYGLIISAGKQSRFKDPTPKALMQIDSNKTLLDLNIDNLNRICDSTYVVVSHDNAYWFEGYNTIEIESGFGCGDAIMRAMNNIDFTDSDKVIIQWGDCYISSGILDLLKEYNLNSDIVIPCEYTKDPYTNIVKNNKSISVQFKKYGEVKNDYGYHDLSVFLANANSLKKYLNKMSNNITKNGKYEHKHGNEFTFLDIFNDTDICGEILECSQRSYYFNTIEEFNIFKEEIKDILIINK